ncbi:unnamed protein product [Prunus armeniaca]
MGWVRTAATPTTFPHHHRRQPSPKSAGKSREKSLVFDSFSLASFSIIQPPFPTSEISASFGIAIPATSGHFSRVRALSCDSEFFRRKVIALDTHVLPTRGHYRKGALCPDVISRFSQARKGARISIWIPFES